MVVDDQADARIMVRAMLEQAGHEVLEAAHGFEALERVEREHPDVLVLDISLDDVEGMAVLRRIRAHGRLSRLPVIMLSAHSSPVTQEEARRLGCSAYLTKPVNAGDLVRAVDMLLSPPG